MAIKLRNTISNISAGTTSMTLNISCNIGDTIVLSFWCRDENFTISSGWNLVFKHNILQGATFQPHGTFYKTATSTTETVTITQASGRLMMCLSAFYSDVGGALTVKNDASNFFASNSTTTITSIEFSRDDGEASIFHVGRFDWANEWTTNPNDLTRILTVTSDRSGVFWDDGTKTAKRSFIPSSTVSVYAFTRTILQEQATTSKKYLLQSEEVYYTIAENALQTVEIPELNAQAFSDFGFEEVPPSELLKTLTNPKVLFWHDSENDLPTLKADLTALPFPQILEHTVDMTHPSINTIDAVSYAVTGNPTIAFSKDGIIWESFDGTAWSEGYGNFSPTLTPPVLNDWRGDTKVFYIRVELHENDIFTNFKLTYTNY